MERKSCWPSCLTDLEYSNLCCAAEVVLFGNVLLSRVEIIHTTYPLNLVNSDNRLDRIAL